VGGEKILLLQGFMLFPVMVQRIRCVLDAILMFFQ